MTLIIAIQAKDSIILSADKCIIPAKNNMSISPFYFNECKLHLWEKGVVSGSGEFQVIKSVNQWLQQNQDVSLLPKALNDIKKQRIIKVGQHEQITNSSIIFSKKDKDTPKLYSIGWNHELEELKSGDIVVLCPTEHRFSSASMLEIQNLYTKIKEYNLFTNNQSWINHYLTLLSSIYKKQSLSCEKISTDFHVFFQSSSYSTVVHMMND